MKIYFIVASIYSYRWEKDTWTRSMLCFVILCRGGCESNMRGILHSPMGRPATNVQNTVQKCHEDSTNSKSRPNAKSPNNQGAGGTKLPDLRLQIGKTKPKMAGSDHTSGKKATNTRPEPMPWSKGSRRHDIEPKERKPSSATPTKTSSTVSQDNFEINEIQDNNKTQGHSQNTWELSKTPQKALTEVLKGGSVAASSSLSSLSSSSSSLSSSWSANRRNSLSSRSGSDNDNSKGKGANKDPVKEKLPVADKQPALSKDTSRIPKLPQQHRSQKGSMERQMRALIISDYDLDRYNLHNPLADMMDISNEDWDYNNFLHNSTTFW